MPSRKSRRANRKTPKCANRKTPKRASRKTPKRTSRKTPKRAKQNNTIFRPKILIPESNNDINVYELDYKLFEYLRNGSFPTLLIEYYASWCGACINFKPVYEEVGIYYKLNNLMNYKRYGEQGKQTIITRIDADRYSDIAVQNNIKSFPTIVLYVIGKDTFGENVYNQFIYTGPRTLIDIVKFIEKHRQ